MLDFVTLSARYANKYFRETEKCHLMQQCNNVLRSLNFDFEIKKRQRDIIRSVLQGNDTFAVLPTGYGK